MAGHFIPPPSIFNIFRDGLKRRTIRGGLGTLQSTVLSTAGYCCLSYFTLGYPCESRKIQIGREGLTNFRSLKETSLRALTSNTLC